MSKRAPLAPGARPGAPLDRHARAAGYIAPCSALSAHYEAKTGNWAKTLARPGDTLYHLEYRQRV